MLIHQREQLGLVVELPQPHRDHPIIIIGANYVSDSTLTVTSEFKITSGV